MNLPVTCKGCGVEFSVKSSDHRVHEGQKTWFCSHECMDEYRRRQTPIVACLSCGTLFATTRNEYCSKAWRELRC